MMMQQKGFPWRIVVFVAVLIGATGFLVTTFPEALQSQDRQISLTHSLLFLAVLGGSAVVQRRFSDGHLLRNISIWLFIGGILFVGYSFRAELKQVSARLRAELLPFQAQVTGENVSLRASLNGHFIVEATVDGVAIRFLVDSGASDVVISPSDAARLGFDVSALHYSKFYQTANGTVAGAPVRLGSIQIGTIRITDVRASVNAAQMGHSLLGVSFLGRLSGYEVNGDILTLKP